MTGSVPGEKSIFLEAIEIDSKPQRREFLAAACAGNQQLRAAVEGLLRAHENEPRLLRIPDPPIRDNPSDDSIGVVIDRYRLLRQIGEGGMGIVYLAEQTEPVQRQVAIKIIKPGMDSKQVIGRFEAERQALAMMDHPHIARVLDAGAIERLTLPSDSPAPSNRQTALQLGQPYFVMEWVRGIPITEYCRKQRLDIRSRLELFISVCQAIQHAHQKGVIHRDLKPSNVLVEHHESRGVPKVIDFGVAKAVDRKLTEHTLHTSFAQLVGTPLYMSPEQAELSKLDIDTRSDVYSLGVLLYELLTGTTPFDRESLQQAGYDEMRRMIREEDPLRPSQRVSTLNAANSAAVPHKSVDQRRLAQSLQGELDWIVMKCLDKDRGRRYQTASALALDVQCHLNDEPVQACPPSIGYLARKFVHRHRGPVIAAALVLLALVAGIVGTTWGLIRAEHARKVALTAQGAEEQRALGERRAKEEAQRRLLQIEKGARILIAVFQDLDPDSATSGDRLRVLLGQRLAEAAKQLDGEAVGDPLMVARLQHGLGLCLSELGHPEPAEAALAKAEATREFWLGSDHLDTAATRQLLAMICRDRGQHALAETKYQQALAVRLAKLGPNHADTLTTQHYLALLYHAQGRYDLAESLCKDVLSARAATLGIDHADTLTTKHRLAMLYRQQGKLALSETVTKEVLEARTAMLGADHLDTAATKQHLAFLYCGQEQFDDAETLYNAVLAVRAAKLGVDHPDTLSTQHHLAMLYEAQGKHEAAEKRYQELLAIRTAKLGADHPTTLATRHSLTLRYQARGEYELAEESFKEMLAIRIDKLGPDHPDTLYTQLNLARMYWAMKDYEKSIPLLKRTLEQQTATLGADHPDSRSIQAALAFNCCDAGRFDDAALQIEELLPWWRKNKVAGEPDVFVARVIERLAQHYDMAGQPETAAKWRMELKRNTSPP